MQRMSPGNCRSSRFSLKAIMLLSIAALVLAGCGTSYWTNITEKGLAPSVVSSISSVVTDPAHDIIYTTTSGQGVWRCTNPGTNPNWTHMLGGAKLDFVSCVLYEPTHNVLYAAANSGVYRWANPASSASWNSANGVGGNSSLAYDPARDMLYAGTMAGVYGCTNPASSPVWADTGGGVEGSSIYSLVCDPAHNVLYAGTDTQGLGIWKYQGGVWTNLDKNFSASKSIGSAWSLAYDSARDVLYAVTDKGILRCAKPGTTPSWASISEGMSSYTFGSLAYDPGHNMLYAGAVVPGPPPTPIGTKVPTPKVNTKSHGVWACANPNTNSSWTDTGGALISQDIEDVCFDATQRVLYAVAVQKAVWRYKPPANH